MPLRPNDPQFIRPNESNAQPPETATSQPSFGSPAEPPTNSAPVVVVGQPAPPPTTPPQPPTQPTFGSPTAPIPPSLNQVQAGGKKHRGKKFWALLIIIVLFVLGGGSAAAYFGYYTSPGFIWKQSLSNMNKGYASLLSYEDTQAKTHYKGFSEDGSFKVDADGTNYDGSASIKTYGSDSTASLKLDLGVATFGLEERSLTPPNADAPDVYVQFNGLKDADTLLGGALGPKIDSLDGQWMVIDHNLIDDYKNSLTKQSTGQLKSKPPLTRASIDDFLKAAGTVNQQYVFTTDKTKSVTTVVKNIGQETIDGHKTYHYKVGFIKANVKAYIVAMCSAFKQSQLAAWVAGEEDQSVNEVANCNDLASSADGIKSSDTVDVWADMSTHLIYKVRISAKTNPALNFVDIGLNYKGGSSYPLFISGQSGDSASSATYTLTATINTKTNAITLSINAVEKGDTPLSLTGNFTFTPSNMPLSVTAPAGAKSLVSVLDQLGLSQYLTELESISPSTAPFTAPLIQSQ